MSTDEYKRSRSGRLPKKGVCRSDVRFRVGCSARFGHGRIGAWPVLPCCPPRSRSRGTARSARSFQGCRDPRAAPPTRRVETPTSTSTVRARRSRRGTRRGGQGHRHLRKLPSYEAMLDNEGAADPGGTAILGDESLVSEQIHHLEAISVTNFAAARPGSSDEHQAHDGTTPRSHPVPVRHTTMQLPLRCRHGRE
jgi:hypothetical protein